jgi:hypothetical protein
MRPVVRAIVVGALCLATISCGRIGDNREPWCRPVPATELMAVSVPTASLVPCVRELPAGWTFDGFQASDGGSSFGLLGPPETTGRALVAFSPSCPGARGSVRPSDEDGVELLEEVRRRSPFAARWTYRFEGGCARIDLALPAGAEVDRGTRDLARALSFVPRASLD